jgi:hypothetical protein
MHKGIKVAVWAAVFLACAGVGAFIAAHSNPFPPGVDRPGASPSASVSVAPSQSPQPLPIKWVGSLKSFTYHQLYVGGRCTSRWGGYLRFTVADSGRIEGSGAAHLSGPLECDFPIAQVQTRRVALVLTGRVQGGRLTLRLVPTGISPSSSHDFGGFDPFLPVRITVTVRHDAVNERVVRQRIDEQGRGTYFWSTAFDIARVLGG